MMKTTKQQLSRREEIVLSFREINIWERLSIEGKIELLRDYIEEIILKK